MIGLRTGTWTFTVEAPGIHSRSQAPAPVRVAGTPPMAFALARDPGPIPGALDKNVIQLVTAANTLRDRGQYDQALTAYQQIRDQNPKLTSVSFVMAGVYRTAGRSRSRSCRAPRAARSRDQLRTVSC